MSGSVAFRFIVIIVLFESIKRKVDLADQRPTSLSRVCLFSNHSAVKREQTIFTLNITKTQTRIRNRHLVF